MQKWIRIGVRVVFGGMFVAAGLTKVLPLPPAPLDLPPAALAFVSGLAGTGYFMPLLGGVEVLAGVAIVAGVFVPLALVVLSPVVVHIALFHAVLVPQPGMVAFVLAAQVFLAWTEREAFRPLLSPRAPAGTTQRTRFSTSRIAAAS